MGRKSTLDEAALFAALGRQLAAGGGATLQQIVAETGVSVGSIYHRFQSREGLLAEAWLDAVRAFQALVIAVLEDGAGDAGERAALVTPQFCRAERARATLLVCCRRSELVGDATPEHLRREIDRVNERASAALRGFARRNGLSLAACRLALVAIPLGAVRMYLPAQSVPPSLDRYVLEACRAVLKAGAA